MQHTPQNTHRRLFEQLLQKFAQPSPHIEHSVIFPQKYTRGVPQTITVRFYSHVPTETKHTILEIIEQQYLCTVTMLDNQTALITEQHKRKLRSKETLKNLE